MEWADWLNVYSKISVKSSLLKWPNVCFEIRNFLTYLGAIFLQSLHLPLHPKPLPSLQSKILWTKQREIKNTLNKTKTVPCPTTKLSLLISKSFVGIKQSVISVALNTSKNKIVNLHLQNLDTLGQMCKIGIHFIIYSHHYQRSHISLPKFEWNRLNYPSRVEAVRIHLNISNCTQNSMKLLYCMLPKLVRNSLKLCKLNLAIAFSHDVTASPASPCRTLMLLGVALFALQSSLARCNENTVLSLIIRTLNHDAKNIS